MYPSKIKEMNKDLLLFLNIESREAVSNLESMLSIDGVDGIFIGPHDLSVSMNCPEDWENTEYQVTIIHEKVFSVHLLKDIAYVI